MADIVKPPQSIDDEKAGVFTMEQLKQTESIDTLHNDEQGDRAL
jgi:hypothetical protein